MKVRMRVLGWLCALAAVSQAALTTSDPRTFTNSTAFKYMLHSGMAYSYTPAECVKSNLDGYWDGYRVESFKLVDCPAIFGKENQCMAVVSIHDESKEIVLAFRGTDDPGQLISEGVSMVERMKDFRTGGKVNDYWLHSYNLLSEYVESKVPELVKQYPSYHWVITGHSLGGAQAAIAANILVHDGVLDGDNVTLYTYGQPRTGDWDFAQNVNKWIPNKFRVVNYRDIVPHLPPCDGHKSCKQTKGKPYHHAGEVWYDNHEDNGNFNFCGGEPIGEDEAKGCANHILEKRPCIDIWDCVQYHRFYFDVHIGNYGEYNCTAYMP